VPVGPECRRRALVPKGGSSRLFATEKEKGMGDWATYSTLEALLNDVQTRFREAERQGTSCSFKISNVTGVYTLLLDQPTPQGSSD
jgi:hypothetical protein